MTAHDEHLTAYRVYPTYAYCYCSDCADYGVPITVIYEEENGVGTIRDEECSNCGTPLRLGNPSETP